MTTIPIQSFPPPQPLQESKEKTAPSGFREMLSHRQTQEARSTGTAEAGAQHPASSPGTSPAPVKIGTVSSKNPTVSNLLIKHPSFGKDCWNIIYSKMNRDKGYTRIQEGTDIFINPHTRELLWGDMPGLVDTRCMTAEKTTPPEPPPSALGKQLSEAVRPMIGNPYEDMNCYELVVKGLDKIGIRYGGKGGLGRQLMAMAAGRGMPANAYLNGEGIIRHSGAALYRRTFNSVVDVEAESRQVIEELTPHLETGGILSFSTESRGHTGIVSRREGIWTYINSGVMDNALENGSVRKGVGEEALDREIRNWLQSAASRKESLVITFGRLSSRKLAAYDKRPGDPA